MNFELSNVYSPSRLPYNYFGKKVLFADTFKELKGFISHFSRSDILRGVNNCKCGVLTAYNESNEAFSSADFPRQVYDWVYVLPEADFEPFKDSKEFLGVALKKGPLALKEKSSDAICTVLYIVEDGLKTENGVCNWEALLETFTFLDGSPCGKEV